MLIPSIAILTRKSTKSVTLLFFTHTSPFSSLCKRIRFSAHLTPPSPKKIPFTVSAHGKTWQDHYRWMSNKDDPDLLDYLIKENSYADAFMSDTVHLQRKLFSEMKSRMPTNISTPPEPWGPWLYYQYIPEGKEYPVLCRTLKTKDDGWVSSLLNYIKGTRRLQILLDWNEIAESFGYVHVGTCRVSPDHNFLAYTLDITGSEQFMLQIKNLQTGFVFPKSRVDGVVSLAWANNSQTLFYTLSDEKQRPYRVCCTGLGSGAEDAITIFSESDSNFCVDITSTKDGRFITVNSSSRTSSEVHVIDANDPVDGLQRVRKRVQGVQYFLEHHNGFFYILTNTPLMDNEDLVGGGYYLARCEVKDLQSSNWQNVIVPGCHGSFQDMDIFDGHMVLFLEKEGCPMFCSITMPIDANCKHQMTLDDLNPWIFPLPSNFCQIVPGSNHDFMTSIYRVVLSSPVMPDVIIDYDMSNQKFSIVQQEEVVGVTKNKFNTDKVLDTRNTELLLWKDLSETLSYERKEVISHDGVSVPLTILFSKGAHTKGHSPGILLGYGSYGENLDKSWCVERLSLLDRGWLVAFADVRGGGGGPSASWHKDGTGLFKINSIQDFVACANYLINEDYVHKDRLCGAGFSAGGLLLGATINMHPYLLRAAILKVPFLDVCNTLLDPNLPLTTLDHEEFGDPNVPTQFKFIQSYSPYDNIPSNECCPSVLVTASFHDSRVGVWEAAKWVAKVREKMCPSCSHSVILKTNLSGGHFGEGGRFGQCEEAAFEYAFLMKVIGDF